MGNDHELSPPSRGINLLRGVQAMDTYSTGGEIRALGVVLGLGLGPGLEFLYLCGILVIG